MKIEDVARPGLLALGVVGVAATALLGFAAGVAVARDPEVLRSLWAAPQREFHHSAIDIMQKQVRSIDESDMALLEELFFEIENR
jgi:hypothetical protein